MSESVIADFVGRFSSELSHRSTPVRGRVVLSQKRLVLAVNDDDKMTIPLSAVVDVAVGHIPADLEDFFDSTVTVAFERGDGSHVAVIEADDGKIDKFSTVLFKAILNGTETTVRHPARVGGRVRDTEYVPARLVLRPAAVEFRQAERTLSIGLASVTGFERSTREVAGADRQVLAVRHTDDGESTMTLVGADSARKLSVLGRYLRLEYAELVEDLTELDAGRAETELLVALYAGAGGNESGAALANVVDADASQVRVLLDRMREQGLVVETARGIKLTPKGRVFVSNHTEDVNV